MNNLTSVTAEVLSDKIELLQERIGKINDRLRLAGAPVIEMEVAAPRITNAEEHGYAGVTMTTSAVTLKRSIDTPNGNIELLGKTTVFPNQAKLEMSHQFFKKLDNDQVSFFENPPHPCHCDHCNTQRNRSTLFVFNTDAGLFRVGSGCADEFAGLQKSHMKRWTQSFEDAVKVLDELSNISLVEAQSQNVVLIDDFLNEAVLVVSSMGYFSATEYGSNNTGAITFESVMNKSDDYGVVDFEYPPEVKEKAIAVKNYVMASEYRQDDRNVDYFVNLRHIINNGCVSRRSASKMASAVIAFEKHERNVKKADKFKEYCNNFVGKEKERLVFKDLKVEACFPGSSELYGNYVKIHMLDSKNNLIIWKRSGDEGLEEGTTVNLLGTVASYSKWFSKFYGKEVCETRINRCKELTKEEVLVLEEKEQKKAARLAKKQGLEESPSP